MVSISITLQLLTVSITVLKREFVHKIVNNVNQFQEYYDYIVVGAGAAGCVVAKRLSDNRDNSVLLLEAGGPQSFISDVPGMADEIQNNDLEFDWKYTIYQQKRWGLGLAKPYHEPKGKVVGGSSTINSMIYMRGNARVYDNWVQSYGANGWSYAEVLPYFIKSENNSDFGIVSQNPGFHGTDGPLSVSSQTNKNIVLKAIIKSYNEFGFPTVDLNGRTQLGTAIAQSTIRNGFRESSANAYIEPNPNPNNLFVSTNSFVTKVVFNRNDNKLIASGIELFKNGHKYRVKANKEVILSAGAYNSPKILILSGIGPEEHLRELGIPCLLSLPVGNNLQEHVQAWFFYMIRDSTYYEPLPELTIKQIYELITTHSGGLAGHPYTNTFVSTKSNPTPDWPNIVLETRVQRFDTNLTKIVSYYSPERADEWREYFGPYLGRIYLRSLIVLKRPRSRGWVRLSSSDPFSKPIINPNFFDSEQDFADLVEAIKFQLYFLSHSLISKYIQLIPKPIPGCTLCTDRPIYECDSYIRCYVREIGEKEHHNCGTCRMGSVHRSDTVVDSRLRVKNISGLRVCDTSIMPTIHNGDGFAPTLMIGEKCSELIREDYQ